MSDAPPDPKPPSRFDPGMAGQWTGVFLINLPVPVILSLGVTFCNGVIGLIAGLVVLYWSGLVVCAGRFRFSRSLIWGSCVVAISQPIPVLHVVCGGLASYGWEAATGHSLVDLKGQYWTTDRTALNNLGMFAVILVAGMPFGLVAILIGAFFRLTYYDPPYWFDRFSDPDPDGAPSEYPTL